MDCNTNNREIYHSSINKSNHINEAAERYILSIAMLYPKQDEIVQQLLHQKPLGLKPVADTITKEDIDKALTIMFEMDRLKVSKVEVLSLQISSWKRKAVQREDIVARFFFSTKQMEWEIREQGYMNKFTIEWDHILCMEVSLQENLPDILQIKLNQQPTFSQQAIVRPRQYGFLFERRIDDNTLGFPRNSVIWHKLEFPSGVLLKHIQRLLRFDNHRFPCLIRRFYRNVPQDLHQNGLPSVIGQTRTQMHVDHNFEPHFSMPQSMNTQPGSLLPVELPSLIESVVQSQLPNAATVTFHQSSTYGNQNTCDRHTLEKVYGVSEDLIPLLVDEDIDEILDFL